VLPFLSWPAAEKEKMVGTHERNEKEDCEGLGESGKRRNSEQVTKLQ
jgi:hypothetical protein